VSNAELRRIMAAIQRVLKRREHLHLLEPKWRRANLRPGAPASTGFCSLAAQTLYFLAGGQESGFTPWRWRDKRTGDSHWWLVDEKGRIWDPTADQFEDSDPGYERGRGGGFPTPKQGRRTQPPSKRAAELMAAVVEELQGR
jgi:hypothetical protein